MLHGLYLKPQNMKKLLFLFFLLNTVFPVNAQDDLSSILDTIPPRAEVEATFKSSRIINLQSNETVHRHTLDFRVAHRFGAVGKQSGGTRHNLYGLDNSSDIRIAFEFGITGDLTVGISRTKYNEDYEALTKYRLLKQTNDNHIPVAITLFGSMVYSDKVNPDLNYDNVSTSKQNIRRLGYTLQAIIARKFSPRLSLELAPTLVHRNFITDIQDENSLFALGVAGRIKLTRSMAVIADYIYNFNDLRKINNDNGYYNALGVGVEFETGGHVFSIMFTNAEAILEQEFIAETKSSWSDGGFRFSFNISRNFKL